MLLCTISKQEVEEEGREMIMMSSTPKGRRKRNEQSRDASQWMEKVFLESYVLMQIYQGQGKLGSNSSTFTSIHSTYHFSFPLLPPCRRKDAEFFGESFLRCLFQGPIALFQPSLLILLSSTKDLFFLAVGFQFSHAPLKSGQNNTIGHQIEFNPCSRSLSLFLTPLQAFLWYYRASCRAFNFTFRGMHYHLHLLPLSNGSYVCAPTYIIHFVRSGRIECGVGQTKWHEKTMHYMDQHAK